jgi:hypothetical protein
MACRNGTRVTASAWQRVDPGGQATRVLASTELRGMDECDAAASFEVRNIRVYQAAN